MATALYALALLCAIADWNAVARKARRMELITRPATLAAITAAAWAQTFTAHDERAAPFFIFALLASLAGDVLLMGGERWFIVGTGAFGLAQIAYSAGLLPTVPPGPAALLALLTALLVVYLFRSIAGGLRRGGQGALLGPVSAYAVVISVMLFAAWAGLFREEWTAARRWLGVAGATMFTISDVLLAWGKFVSPESARPVLSIALYHLGQMALAASFAQV